MDMTTVCQSTFISSNNCTTPGGDVDDEGAMHEWRQRVNGKSLYVPPNFAATLKMLFLKVYLKKGGGGFKWCQKKILNSPPPMGTIKLKLHTE